MIYYELQLVPNEAERNYWCDRAVLCFALEDLSLILDELLPLA